MADNRRAQPFYMTATTQFGLEEVLAGELRALGAKIEKVGQRAVEFTGNQQLLYEAVLWCRTAMRILKPFANFYAPDEKALYREVGRIDWQQYIYPEQTFAITAVVNKSNLEHSLFVAQLAKDAIVDQFRNRTGERPNVDVRNPDIRLHLHMLENEVVMSLDASGDSLHRRGYRQQTNAAPLNEVLAAGLLLLTGWDGKKTLIDPMCGSGTLLTEAALIAQRIAPGLYHQGKFGFENWADFDVALWESVRMDARQLRLEEPQAYLAGSDISREFIELARENVAAADLEDFIRLGVRDVAEAKAPAKEAPGLVIMNPPYGERIGEEAEMEALYKTIGDTLKSSFQEYDAYIFTGNLEAAKRIGLKTSRRVPLYNGPIECRLLKYELYRGTRRESHSPTSQVLDEHHQKDNAHEAFAGRQTFVEKPLAPPSTTDSNTVEESPVPYMTLGGAQEHVFTTDTKRWDKLKDYSRTNRKQSTEAEQALWRELRGQRLGVKFRRQHAIEQFIVDFVSIGVKLIVEVDGAVHDESAQAEYDGGRTHQLEELGYRIIRFSNERVLNTIDAVLTEIRRHIENLTP